MQQILYFLQKYKYFLFFLTLEFVALLLIINNNNFHKSKFFTSANFFTSYINEKQANFSEYFNLKEINEKLVKENEHLKNKLELVSSTSDSTSIIQVIDSIQYNQKYVFVAAKIINNNYKNSTNFLTIDKGLKHNINKEMAVVNAQGVIGITEKVNSKYTRVQSILNKNIRINARFKQNSYFGTLIWNGKDYNTLQLSDLPRQANFNIGDTIITGGKSAIFPEGILIGTVAEKPKKITSTTEVNIKLFNDMSNIRNAYVIINLEKDLIKEVENTKE